MDFVTRQSVLVKGFGVDNHLIRGAEVLKDDLTLAAMQYHESNTNIEARASERVGFQIYRIQVA